MIKQDWVIRRYKHIQKTLLDIFVYKIEQYGIGMYENQTEAFKYWAAFFNVRRKTLRMEELTQQALGSEPEAARAKLISDYKDLANYAIMAVQILEEDHREF